GNERQRRLHGRHLHPGRGRGSPIVAGPARESSRLDPFAQEGARHAPARGALLPRRPRSLVMFGPLVDSDWLHEHLNDPDVRVIDFRWYLLGRKGSAEYARGHIPGAVFVELEDVTGKEGGGRHPMPTAEQFQSEMRKAGVSGSTRVVVYDDAGASVAARLWFLLGYFGHRAQAVLDGGIGGWGGPLETKSARVAPGDFVASVSDTRAVLDSKAVRKLRGVPLIDARAGERYR